MGVAGEIESVRLKPFGIQVKASVASIQKIHIAFSIDND